MVRVEPFHFCSCSNWVNLKEEMSAFRHFPVYDSDRRGKQKGGEVRGGVEFIQRD